MGTVDEIFEKQIKPLSVVDQLQLVRLIMNDLAESAPRWVVDENDTWSDEDLHDVARASLHYGTQSLEGEDEHVTSR